jgi:hypothetical protein
VNVGARAITAAEARLLLLNADDNAIIIVGGRSMRAGYMKRVLSTAAQSVAPPAR